MRTSMQMRGGFGLLLAAGAAAISPAHAGCTDNLGAARELNIRKGPSTEFEPVGKIPGEACGIRIGGCDEGWCRVNYRGLDGYASAFYLQRTEGEQRRVRAPWRGIAEAIFDRLGRDRAWQRIGVLDVGGGRDRDVIQLDRGDGRFEALRMRVRGAPVDFRRVVVVYGNGQRDNLDFARTLPANSESGEIALRGRQGRFIDRLILVYGQARPSGRASEVEVWARASDEPGGGRDGRGPGPRAFGPGWEQLGAITVGRGRDRDQIRIGRDDGRFNAVGVRALRNDVRIRRMVVEYGNGRRHEVDVDRRVSAGQSSDVIELRGQQGRFIRSIGFVYETVGRGPEAMIEVWGRAERG